ncbi:hypothetical protein [Bradyrhizobium sp. STM 3843]|uniref:hypothetical protein n=1 Tax=Bradyrhizobium sp. STM 3843 TaxID=551947 RepID=UPI001FCC4EF0|nr:hypothetical protein [Bradyrhizobium sp. STM 3843]
MHGAVGGQHAFAEEFEQRALSDAAQARQLGPERPQPRIIYQAVDIRRAQDQEPVSVVRDRRCERTPMPHHTMRIRLQLGDGGRRARGKRDGAVCV